MKDILPSITLKERYLNDCEMIGIGAYSPLNGFMSKDDALEVINNMQLRDGTLWPIPILLPTFDEKFMINEKYELKDSQDRIIAIFEVEEIFNLDPIDYAKKVYGTTDENHPGVKVILEENGEYVSGKIQLINKPLRNNIGEDYYLEPKDTKKIFKEKGWKTVVAFQTRNPIHRAHEYIQKCALEFVDGLLVHPIVGETKKDDIPAEIRMKCYEVLIDNYYSKNNTLLSVMPAPMRYAGPREAILHAIIRQNYGCTHFIVGRDHAGVGDYYGTYEAQELVLKYSDRLEITTLPFEHAFYCQKCRNITSKKTCPHDSSHYIHLSGTQVRKMLKEGHRPPREFTREKVADVLLEWVQNSN